MKRGLILFGTMIWLSLTGFVYSADTGITVRKSGNDLVVNWHNPGIQLEKVQTEEGLFVRLCLKGFGVTGPVGSPQLPVLAIPVPVEPGMVPEITDLNINWETQYLYAPVYPVQQPWPKNRPLADRPFSFDRNAYRVPQHLPVVLRGESFIMHGVHGASIVLRPVRYNPLDNTVEVAQSISFRIPGVAGAAAAVRESGPVFSKALEQVFPDVPITKDLVIRAMETGVKTAPGAGRYLIITDPAFQTALDSFVTHKQGMGYDVTVVTTDTTGTTKETIKQHIQDAYDNAGTRPDFLLLVGNENRIPAWQGNVVNAPGVSGELYTDLFYSTLDGSDYFPDVFVGRFPVTSTDELNNMITKTVWMENRAATVPRKALLMASSDPSFWPVAEATQNYVNDVFLIPEGYDNTKLYFHNDGIHDGNFMDVTAAIDDGQHLVLYTGHGSYTSWADPGYSISRAQALENSVYPYTFTFACITGAFVSGAFAGGGVAPGQCFSEALVVDPHGSVSSWASSVNSFWDQDDVLEREMVRACYDDGLYQVGPMFTAGKLGMYAHYAGDDFCRAYFEQYNLMGDPGVFVTGYAAAGPEGRIFTDVDRISGSTVVTVEVWDTDRTGGTLTVYATDPETGLDTPLVLNSAGGGKYSGTFNASQLAPGLTGSARVRITYTDPDYGTKAMSDVHVDVAVDRDGPILQHGQASSVSATQAVIHLFFSEAADWTVTLKQGVANLGSLNGNDDDSIELILTGLTPDTGYAFDLALQDELGNNRSIPNALVFSTSPGTLLLNDSCDTDTGNLISGSDMGADVWSLKTTGIARSGGICWFGQDVGTTTDSFLKTGPLTLTGSQAVLSFWHAYSLESGYDGAVLEISTDGSSWSDLGGNILTEGYTGQVPSNFGNPIAQGGVRDCWTGSNGAMEMVQVDLSDYTGQTVYVRFRIGCYSSYSADGWYVDDVTLETYSTGPAMLTFVNVTPDSHLTLATGNEAADLEVAAYDAAGNGITAANWNIPANSRRAGTVTELFDPVNVGNVASIRVLPDAFVAGWQMTDTTDARGPMRTFTPAFMGQGRAAALVPHVANETWYWDTFVAGHNLNEQAIFPVFGDAPGAGYRVLTEALPANGTADWNVETDVYGDVFPAQGMTFGSFTGEDSVSVGLAATETFEKQTIANSASLTLDMKSGTRLIVAHVDNTSYWWTGIALDNLSASHTAAVNVTGYRSDGTVSAMKQYGVKPGEKLIFVTSTEFPVDTAWFDIASDRPLIGYELFGTTNNRELIGLGIPTSGATDQLLPVVDLVNDWHGIVVVNPNETEADVTVTFYDGGSVLHETTFSLDPYAKFVDVIEGLFVDAAGGMDYRDTDLIRIRSTIPVASFCIEGDTGHNKAGGVLAVPVR